MAKGPKLNKTGYNFTTRDNLGIESATAGIQDSLCPIVTTVTPRAFYWPFVTWNYYDYHMNYNTNKKSSTEFNAFLNRNSYFMALANMMVGNDQNYLAAKTKVENYNDTSKNTFCYSDPISKSDFSQLGYYNAGCLNMGFTTNKDIQGNYFSVPKITKEIGEPLACAFMNIIKETEYFKKYRLTNTPVPREVLQELGTVLKFNLDGFDEVKSILKKSLFEPQNNERLNNQWLIQSSKYVNYLYYQHNIKKPNDALMRRVLFDYFSPRGEAKQYDASLTEIINAWEIVVGRQYLTMAVELMWKYMLWMLVDAMTLKEWIERCINTAKWSIDYNKPLKTLLPECNYSFDAREKMISIGSGASKKYGANIETSLKILLSLYNRFINRDELNANFLHEGDKVSISSLIKLIDNYCDKPVIEFIQYIMVNWIIKKHEAVAREKLLQGRDGFYFEKIDDLYIPAGHLTEPNFKNLRMIQLMQVMKDLDMLVN